MTAKFISVAVLAGVVMLPVIASAADPDWKRGRIYYRAVCTSCHEASGGSIAPSTKTKAEWSSYLVSNKHNKGKDSVSQYWGKAYRDSIKSGNKAAEKFAAVPEGELAEDIKAFLMRGAKDGESPASCS